MNEGHTSISPSKLRRAATGKRRLQGELPSYHQIAARYTLNPGPLSFRFAHPEGICACLFKTWPKHGHFLRSGGRVPEALEGPLARRGDLSYLYALRRAGLSGAFRRGELRGGLETGANHVISGRVHMRVIRKLLCRSKEFPYALPVIDAAARGQPPVIDARSAVAHDHCGLRRLRARLSCFSIFARDK